MQVSFFFAFEVPTQDQQEFLDSWKKLEINWRKTPDLIDAQLYVQFADKKERKQQSSNWLVQTKWQSLKDFIYAISTKEFQDFIQKWEIIEASPTSYPVINQNEILTREYKPIYPKKNPHKQIRISNNLFMVIFFFIAVIIVGIILYFR